MTVAAAIAYYDIMILEIQDDFDLEKIALSGQCFRMKRFEDDTWRFITGSHVLYIRPEEDQLFSVSCEREEWDHIWRSYFDLDRSYQDICTACQGRHPFADQAMAFGRGIRVLRQDPWETLLTFIISQRKNIPAIAKAVEALSAAYGNPVIITEREILHPFPTPEQMRDASESDLRELGLGYRAPYVLDAVSRTLSGELDLTGIAGLGDTELMETLQTVRGVGTKVANCVCLFAYGRTACAPVDVWIDRAIREECNEKSPFPLFGENAGIIQQYIFYYMKNNEERP